MNLQKSKVVMLGTDFCSPGGMTAVVSSYKADGLFDTYGVEFIPTYRWSGFANKCITAAEALARFVALMVQGRVGVVHAHVAARGSFWRKALFLTLGRLGGARTIFHLHDGSFPEWYAKQGPAVRHLVRTTFRRSDRVVVLTGSWATWVQSVEPTAKTVVIGNPVALPLVASTRNAGLILFLGRLWREKGIFDLLQAAAELKLTVPDFRLVCAGDGDHHRVRQMANSLGIGSNVELPGWIDGEKKHALLAHAAIFVLPSYFEGLPIGVLEAMAYGVPVVASDVGGVKEAIADEAGILIKAGDIAGLRTTLESLLCDPARQTQMGAAGRKRVAQHYETARIVERVGVMYGELGIVPRCRSEMPAMQESV